MLQEGDLADVALPGQKLSHSGKDMTEVKGISSRPAGVDAVAPWDVTGSAEGQQG